MTNLLPEIGSLIYPKHAPTFFNTVLEVETRMKDDQLNIRVFYLRIRDQKKIRTTWYPNAETFWKYYDQSK